MLDRNKGLSFKSPVGMQMSMSACETWRSDFETSQKLGQLFTIKVGAGWVGGLVGAITSLHVWAHVMLQHERFSRVSTNMHVWLHIGFRATSYLYRLGWGCLGTRRLGQQCPCIYLFQTRPHRLHRPYRPHSPHIS